MFRMNFNTVKYRYLLSHLNLITKQKNLSSSCDTQRSSYFHKPGNWPLVSETVGQLLDAAAEKYKWNEAIVFCDSKIRKKFFELKEDVDKFAAGLIAIGLVKGDRIGIWSPNQYEWILTQFASAKVGLILVNINPAYQPRELEYCIQKVGIKCIVCAESSKTQNYYDMLSGIIPSLATSGEIKYSHLLLTHIIMISNKNYAGTFKFDDVFNCANNEHFEKLYSIQESIQFDDPYNIQFTSGTTGNPKGATLSHFNVVNNCIANGERMSYRDKVNRICIPLPLYHCFACVQGSLSAVKYGACQVYPGSIYNAEATAEALHAEKCTSIIGTPTVFVDLVNLPNLDNYDFSRVDRGIMGGSTCPAELLKSTLSKLNFQGIISGYGCTENSPAIAGSFPNESLEIRANTVGTPLDHIEIKIVDTNTGCVVPYGHVGQLCTRSPYVMLGYWNDPEKTRECITPEKWYKTGDLAMADESGNIKIVGRSKDMIIRGGENIYPREIEDLLHTHINIAEAHVVGVPDDRMGEELFAWIRIKTGETLTECEVKTFCIGKLAYFKIPRYVHFVETFPMTVSRKIKKFVLREMAVKSLRKL